MKKNKTAVKIVAIVAVVLIIAMLVVVFVLVFNTPEPPEDPCVTYGHDYEYVKVDSTYHKQVCKRCKAETEEEAHIGNPPYESKGEEGHVLVCTKCDFDDTVSHVYDDENDGYCDDCEYLRFATSNIVITSDKTELHRGDEFTITAKIHSTRKDCYWFAICLAFGPLNESGKKLEPTNSVSFELVDYETSLDSYIQSKQMIDSSKSRFDKAQSTVIQGMCIDLAATGAKVSCEEDIEIKIKLKIKDTASASSFNFGVAAGMANFVRYYENSADKSYKDRVDGVMVATDGQTSLPPDNKSHCMKINSIPMSISE